MYFHNTQPHSRHGVTQSLPRVATRSPSTSSAVMCPLWVRRSSSVTGLLSTWLLLDLSLFRTPPFDLRSRGGAAAPPPTPSALLPLLPERNSGSLKLNRRKHTRRMKKILPKGLGEERGCQAPPSVRHINVRAWLSREQET